MIIQKDPIPAAAAIVSLFMTMEETVLVSDSACGDFASSV